MTLGELQRAFPPLVGKLIAFIYAQGYELTFGETLRTAEQAAWNAAHGSGVKDSLHCLRLAIDLNLFKDGVYLSDPEHYRFAGDYWKTLHPEAAWGGDFKKQDADHFSIAYNGVR